MKGSTMKPTLALLTALLLAPLAELLSSRTVVSQEWLAEKLRMKSAANVSQQMKRLDRKRALDKVPEAMRRFSEESNDSPL